MRVAINVNDSVFSLGGILTALFFAMFIGYRLFTAIAKPFFRQIRTGEWRQWKLNMHIKRR